MKDDRITAEMTVAEVLSDTPQTLGIFVEHGFTALKDPETRAGAAHSITIAHVADRIDGDVDRLLDDLNALRSRLAGAALAAATSDGPITANHCPGQIIEQHPHLLDVFVRHGFDSLRDPVLRRTVASMVTLETACRMHGVDSNRLLSELNAAK